MKKLILALALVLLVTPTVIFAAEVKLKWDPTSGASHYVVQSAKILYTPKGANTESWSKVGETTLNEYTFLDVDPDLEQAFMVYAVDNTGMPSEVSNMAMTLKRGHRLSPTFIWIIQMPEEKQP